jgi:lipoprotein-releasing system permease protein
MIEFFVAKRYARAKHKLNFISILSIISTLGITIGVAALVIVLAVFNGFGSIVTDILVSFDPHIKISFLDEKVLSKSVLTEDIFRNIPGIKTVNKIADGKALFINEKTYEVVNLKGIDIDSSETSQGVASKIMSGKFDLSSDNIVIGLTLALKMGVRVGDEITVTSAHNIEKTISSFSIPRTRKFTVAGLFESNNKDYDAGYAITSLSSAQNLFGMKKNFSGYELHLQNFEDAENIKASLEKKLNKNEFTIETWYDLHKQLYNVMLIERWAAYIILCLIIAVATFNIFASLTMTVIEKKRDIGILRSLGVGKDSIRKIFMTSGLMIGVAGTFSGLVLGIIVCVLQLKFKFYAMDPMKYIIDALPIQLRITDLIAISVMALLLSFLAAYFPAKRAAQTVIIESIKYE